MIFRIIIMKKIIFLLISTGLLFFSCKSGKEKSEEDGYPEKEIPQYGGTLRMSHNDYLKSVYPPSVIDIYSNNVSSQVFEGLVKLNVRDMAVIPSLAEKWEIDSTGLVYTFFLKKGVKFHNDACFPNGKGREMKAKDVKFSIENLCKQNPDNVLFDITLKNKLLGANKYYEASSDGKTPSFDLEGVKIIDDYTIQLALESPNSSFLYILSMPALGILPREGVEKYGSKVTIGTGPFFIPKGENISGDKFHLVKNSEYHGVDSLGNKLPFLDSIQVVVLNSKKAELEEFRNGNLDIVIGLPPESIKEIVEEQITEFQSKPAKFFLDRSSEISTEYYSFNLTRKIFKDKKVRQAFNYAIDRNLIIDEILKGEAFGPGEYGITPSSIKGYDVTKIKGYNFDVQKAKQLLAESGYPDGVGFPPVKLELNSGGLRNTNIAIEIQKQLMKNLGVKIELEIESFNQKIEDERYGRADMFRSAWIADYPNPENFLFLFYGKTLPSSPDEPSNFNTSRYFNPKFDELYEKGLKMTDSETAYKYFAEAEQILMDDAAVIVLFYGESYVIENASLKNYFSNPINYKDFSEVYLKTRVVSENKATEN